MNQVDLQDRPFFYEEIMSGSQRSSIFATVLIVAVLSDVGAAAPKPRLLNVIVIDQFPAFFLDKFGDLFGENGFRRLQREGVTLKHAYYSYGQLMTGPGHATIATGRNPGGHGIVLNSWWDREQRRTIYCVEDSAVSPIGCVDCKPRSPVLLRGSVAADEIKLATGGKAKVWGLSLKDRSAILMAGKSADGALWFDETSGRFVTSSYYSERLPNWVDNYHNSKAPERFFKQVWDRSLPDSAYLRCTADDVAWESGKDAGLTNTLPKTIGEKSSTPDKAYNEALTASPFGNDLLFDLARVCVEAESLGTDDQCDVLNISLSSNDEAGHLYGPDSHEILDFTVRTDKQLADWFQFLDEKIGLDHCLIVLTSDHGIAPCPEVLELADAAAPGGRYDSRRLLAAVNASLTAQLSPGPDTVKFVEQLLLPFAYLNDSLAHATTANGPSIVDQAARAFCELEAVDTAIVYSPSMSETSLDTLGVLFRNGYDSTRSGDIYVHLKPNWLPKSICTTHGTAYPYDRHVPVMFMGNEIFSGAVERRTDVRDIAVTICARCGVTRPHSPMTGEVIPEVMR